MATRLTVMLVKSMAALRTAAAMGAVCSRMSTMRRSGSPTRIVVGTCAMDKAIEFPMLARPRSLVLASIVAAGAVLGSAQDADLLAPARVGAVRAYIKSAWTTLTRSTRDLA